MQCPPLNAIQQTSLTFRRRLWVLSPQQFHLIAWAMCNTGILPPLGPEYLMMIRSCPGTASREKRG